jgi:hypothetical protein
VHNGLNAACLFRLVFVLPSLSVAKGEWKPLRNKESRAQGNPRLFLERPMEPLGRIQQVRWPMIHAVIRELRLRCHVRFHMPAT